MYTMPVTGSLCQWGETVALSVQLAETAVQMADSWNCPYRGGSVP